MAEEKTSQEVLAISGQLGGKYPMGFVFTTEKSDVSDLAPYTELDFEGLTFQERMKILEVARLDAEFWMKLKETAKPRIQYAGGVLFFTNSSVREENCLPLPTDNDKNKSEESGLKEEVREHIEVFVSALIGKSVDKVFVGRLSEDPIYKKYLTDYHPLVTRSLSRLSLSVFKAIRGDSLSIEDLPTSAHALAKTVIAEAQQAATNLPTMKESVFSSAETSIPPKGLSDSYEGLLASAILNAAYEGNRKSKKEFGIQTDEPSVLFKSNKVDTAVQSDLPFSDSESDDGLSAISSLTHPTNFTETADEFSYHYVGDQMNGNVTLVQEVEEVISVVEDVDEKSRMYSGTIEKFLSSLSECPVDEGVTRTTFPELGVDMIGGGLDVTSMSYDCSDLSVCERRLAIDNWEENWLFRQRKDSAHSLHSLSDFDCSMMAISDEPIGMFVPTPTLAVTPIIGEKEIDLVSELSERDSYGSLNFSSSDSEKDFDDTGQEEPGPVSYESLEQKERESTEQYACLPFRLLSPPTSLVPDIPVEPFSEERDENGLRIPNFLNCKARGAYDQSKIKFVVKPQNVNVGLGKCLRVRCRPTCSTVVGVAWFFRGQRVLPSDQVLLSSSHGTWTLEVYEVSNNDSGRYSAVAYSADEQCWTDFSVRVVGRACSWSPAALTVSSDVIRVVESSDAKVTGEILGHPEPRIHLAQSPADASRVVLDRSTSGTWIFQVRQVQPADAGSYIMQAWNRLGRATVIFQLVIDQKDEMQVTTSINEEVPVPKKRSKVPRKVQEVLPNPRPRKKNPESVGQDSVIKPSNIEEMNQKEGQLERVTSPGLDEILPALPGSIAEREHKKWSQAVPMPNNPYSVESLLKRMQTKDTTVDICRRFAVHIPPEPTTDEDYDWLGTCRKDYVIASDLKSRTLSQKAELQSASAPELLRERKISENEISADGVQLTAKPVQRANKKVPQAKVQPLATRKSSGDKIDPCRTVVKVVDTKQVKNVKNERSKSRERLDEVKQKQSKAPEVKEPVLPSVKQLASVFRVNDGPKVQERRFEVIPVHSEPSKDTVDDTLEKLKNKKIKSVQEQEEQAFYRIHSLTARSVPQEFRRGLDLSRGRQQDRNIKLPSPSREKADPAKAAAIEPPSLRKPELSFQASKKGVKDSIAKRAAFWDNRIVNGIVEDGEVTEEFPNMTEF